MNDQNEYYAKLLGIADEAEMKEVAEFGDAVKRVIDTLPNRWRTSALCKALAAAGIGLAKQPCAADGMDDEQLSDAVNEIVEKYSDLCPQELAREIRAMFTSQAPAHHHAPLREEAPGRASAVGGSPAPLPRCGDVVFHLPSRETWSVAWADETNIAWCGFPNGMVRTADCEIIKRASDKEHISMCHSVANCSDSRASKVRSLYPDAFSPEPRFEQGEDQGDANHE